MKHLLLLLLLSCSSAFAQNTKLLVSYAAPVVSETLNVHIGPGTAYDVAETIAQGDMLTYISHHGEWIYLRVNESGTNGWVNYKFVK
ncbi:SH3 domain-containing protein [Flavobacterium sp. Sd200]|uniref:SH3 domain-containing protein n=1 Tax=Flavobacterium sp. Sd200 TaxID=2692211 RepID=UPI00136D7027|nr:SH3 domain-containing protein [Flavobacterium sp. Sd200]MXN90506.1 SH3 domain-containing protein [Flavobacterium sp. Sd200]